MTDGVSLGFGFFLLCRVSLLIHIEVFHDQEVGLVVNLPSKTLPVVLDSSHLLRQLKDQSFMLASAFVREYTHLIDL